MGELKPHGAVQAFRHTMKIISSLLLIALLMNTNGCMTYSAIDRAKGHTSEQVRVEKTEKVTERDGISTVIRETSPAGGKSETRFVRESEFGGYAYKPNLLYYAWIPVTVPADVVTSPFQILFFWWLNYGDWKT